MWAQETQVCVRCPPGAGEAGPSPSKPGGPLVLAAHGLFGVPWDAGLCPLHSLVSASGPHPARRHFGAEGRGWDALRAGALTQSTSVGRVVPEPGCTLRPQPLLPEPFQPGHTQTPAHPVPQQGTPGPTLPQTQCSYRVGLSGRLPQTSGAPQSQRHLCSGFTFPQILSAYSSVHWLKDLLPCHVLRTWVPPRPAGLAPPHPAAPTELLGHLE